MQNNIQLFIETNNMEQYFYDLLDFIMDLFDEHQVVLIKLTEFAVYTLVVLIVCDSLYNAINHKIIDLKNEQKLFETMFDENVKIYNGNFDEIEDKFEKIENNVEQLDKQIHYLDKTVKEYTETTDDRIASIEFSNENNYKIRKIVNKITEYFKWLNSIDTYYVYHSPQYPQNGSMKKKYTPEQLEAFMSQLIPDKILLYKSTKSIMEKYFANVNYKFLTREITASESFINDHCKKNCSTVTIDYPSWGNGTSRLSNNPLPYYSDPNYSKVYETINNNRYCFSLSVKKLNETDEEFELRFLQHLLEKCEKAYEVYIPYQMSLDYQEQNQPELL
jgi:hypothetical protein